MTDVRSESSVLDHATTHSIKNQLAIILGFCELLTGTLDDHDPRRNDVRRIETAGRSALTLLRDSAGPGTEMTHDQR